MGIFVWGIQKTKQSFFQLVDNLQRRFDAHVRGNQGLLDGIQGIIIDF